jgi:hypothetical protein
VTEGSAKCEWDYKTSSLHKGFMQLHRHHISRLVCSIYFQGSAERFPRSKRIFRANLPLNGCTCSMRRGVRILALPREGGCQHYLRLTLSKVYSSPELPHGIFRP